jgi:predicted site-specific integrase-resolvase
MGRGRTTPRQPLMTPAEASAYTGYAVGTLRKWRSTGEGPSFIGRGHGVRYRPEDIDAWLDARTTKTA